MTNLEFKRGLNCLGFWATMCIAVTLVAICVIAFVTGEVVSLFRIADIPSIFVLVANILAYFVTIMLGFYYCLSKRSPWFITMQIIATLLIAGAVVVGLFL